MKNIGNNVWLGIMNIIYNIHSNESLENMSKMLLKQLQWLVPYDHALFIAPGEKDSKKIRILASRNFEQEYLDLYEANYKKYDHAAGLKIGGNSIVYRESDIIEEKVYKNSYFYKQFCEPNNIFYVVHLVLCYEDKYCGEVILFRDTDTINASDFGGNAEFILNLLKEHLALSISRLVHKKDKQEISKHEVIMSPIERCGFKYSLTKRETEIMKFLVNNQSTADICDKLVISSNTLKKHTLNIYRKMDINSRVQLINKVQE